MAGVVSEAGERLAEALVAGEAERDCPMLARSVCHGRDARLGGELVVVGETKAVIAQLGEDLGGVDAAGAGQRDEDWTVGVDGDRVLDGRGQLGKLRDQRVEDAGQGANELTLGLGLHLTAQAGRSGAQPLEEEGGRAPATVAVLCEELRQAFLAEAVGTLRRRVAVEEGEGDGRVDVCEDRSWLASATRC